MAIAQTAQKWTPMDQPTSNNQPQLETWKTRVFTFVNHSPFFDGKKIWTMTFDLPGEKVNKFGKDVLSDFEELLPRLQKMAQAKEIDALVLDSAKPGNFIAGADIEMFGEIRNVEDGTKLSQLGQRVIDQWEDLPFPTVVAVDGSCLGGGCEISLASNAIVMSNDQKSKIGLPEVMLGIIPGMGGCVRLPRKVGIANALDLILTSKQLNGKRAVRMGIAEACLPKENFTETVLKWTHKNLKSLKAGRRLAKKPKLGGVGGLVGGFLEGTPMGRGVIFSQAKKGVLKKTRGHYPAPLEAIQTIKDIGTGYEQRFSKKRREKAMLREAQGFGKCSVTDVSKNLVRIFFMTEDIKKATGLPDHQTTNFHKIQNTAVLGAGTMGGGIAQLFADKNMTARMKDINHSALEIGIQAANAIFKKKVKRRRITKREHMQKLNRIAPVLDYSGFQSTDVVVEAIVENMNVKKTVLKELEGEVGDRCVLASNTSSLSINEMQTVLQKPERFVGMHFFNPVHRMPLIEVIRGEKTSDAAVASIFELSKRIGKFPIVVKDGAGFLVNRLLVPYLNEAIYLLAEGALVEDIDRALLDFGMPMGPMELIDEVGVDIGGHVLDILFDAFGERMKPAPITGKIVAAKRLGKKTKLGIYKYNDQKRKELDPSIYQIVGSQPKSKRFSAEEMVDRCVLPMVNEASRCLADGIVYTPQDVDLGMIMGTGFPPFRGGLLRYADSRGLSKVVERLEALSRDLGGEATARFAPADPLKNLANSGKTFYSQS